jgi:tyrosine-specific transport protein
MSATALIAGTTVGAGVLALPAFTVKAGFVPSSAVLLGAWVFMVATGLLIAEVNLNSRQGGGGMISMTRETIGGAGASVSGAAYLFLHYALLVAYIAQACVSCQPCAHM